MDVRTGRIVWTLPQPGAARSWGGTLATSTGLVLFAAEDGTFMAADGTNGRVLWSFQTNQVWRASPMTYSFDGNQLVAIMAGPNVIAFGL